MLWRSKPFVGLVIHLPPMRYGNSQKRRQVNDLTYGDLCKYLDVMFCIRVVNG